ncbi:3-oxoacyl-[acyl-carrier-protein] reductase FabG [Caulifigura coniformis]|uniref:3-oxoacyl-[acyl-carrier-protein] reductase FabG n=1 Tax=Caulifigura coniformis TaxID=2527983 RepID=A0A517SBR0_9PLAN|nr:SDR family oxidoreductase [Caulifigura coniformis]QDT53555.1 3-oxoacyl-[acyl-carrier-protein] reductase FabG [Caulifigura coniformis]
MSKVVVITGATRGLGRALCDRFAEAGWTIAGCGTNHERVSEAASELGAPHRMDAVDTRDAAAVANWASEVTAAVGVPDLLINNAGVINANAPLWEVDVEDFARVVEVNVHGVFHVVRAFAPAMIARKSGIIVNLSSGWGRSTSPDVAPYCASKWAIEGMTRSLAQDLPKGLAAVALNPGIIDTDMLRSAFGAGAGHYPSPEKWSRAAGPFLMSLTSRHNGQSLTVPGVPT